MKLPLLNSHRKVAQLFALFMSAMFFYSCDELYEEIIRHPSKTAQEESANVVYDWYDLIAKIELRRTPQPNVLANNRAFGYIGVGLYETVRPGIRGAVSLSTKLYQMPPMPTPEPGREYLWGASANASLASMYKQLLVGLTDSDRARMDSLENAYNNRYRLSTADAVLTRSQAHGRAVASAIYAWSATDNFNTGSQGYVLPVFPGSWVLTPPAFAAPQGPFLQNSRPFLAHSLTATAPPLPVAYSEDPSSEFYKQAKEVYDIGKALTTEQRATANWWADAGGVGVGVPAPYHGLNIITGLLKSQNARLGRAAEVYAKTGIAMKDGPINTFRGKYQYNLLRPVTYIQRLIDPTWQSYLPNPPYPEYPSGLVGHNAPVTQVLIREFGDIPVTDNTYTWRGLPARQYPSISAMREEAAFSRIYAGIHYRFTQLASIQMGIELGNRIADLNLTPN
ncbi:vanadium-dependent haloperoxidase [Hymenobacter sp. BT188]|uniref:vanadium-dependent haloperoxidase n=1 Tax=Hymenobacter sp. BT188 TaxID=2763504 RepID=UPI001650F7EB|nr:vanadium-dependent haloperoxidase [Hymenobacter sp. BT188]MBC6605813.1 vanadium-dependent haloperoxidase [Hymenobacter sp. BT188]